MEENKYFVPDVSDLHIGYECEASFSSYGGYAILDFSDENKPADFHPPADKESAKFWSPFWIIEEESLFGANNHRDMKTVMMLLKDNRLRTPFLTKEQIEAEGWKCSGGHDKVNRVDFEKDEKWLILIWFDKQKLEIWFKDRKAIKLNLLAFNNTVKRYEGECKSINEFRKICKWIGI